MHKSVAYLVAKPLPQQQFSLFHRPSFSAWGYLEWKQRMKKNITRLCIFMTILLRVNINVFDLKDLKRSEGLLRHALLMYFNII